MYRNLRFKPHDSLDATDFHGRGPAHWPTFYVEFKDSYDLNLMVGILFDLGIFFLNYVLQHWQHYKVIQR